MSYLVIANPGFENAPSSIVAQTSANYVDGTATGSSTTNAYGWAVQQVAGGAGACNAFFDTAQKHSGSYSFKLHGATASYNCDVGLSIASAGVPTLAGLQNSSMRVQPSTAYVFTFWMMTNATANSGSGNGRGGYGRIAEYDVSGNPITTHSSSFIATTTGWTQYTISYTSASNAAYNEIQFQNDGQGGTATLLMDAWFDDCLFSGPTNRIMPFI